MDPETGFASAAALQSSLARLWRAPASKFLRKDPCVQEHFRLHAPDESSAFDGVEDWLLERGLLDHLHYVDEYNDEVTRTGRWQKFEYRPRPTIHSLHGIVMHGTWAYALASIISIALLRTPAQR